MLKGDYDKAHDEKTIIEETEREIRKEREKYGEKWKPQIFEWKNNGGKVIDNQNIETDKIHTFSKEWSIYLEKGTKIYED